MESDVKWYSNYKCLRCGYSLEKCVCSLKGYGLKRPNPQLSRIDEHIKDEHDMMVSNEKYYPNYVCSKCLLSPEECTCNELSRWLVWVDKNIKEHVGILNKKGYRTYFSCEGHYNKGCGCGGGAYIDFNFLGEADANLECSLPDGFELEGGRIIHKGYKKISKEEFERQKKEELANLLDWCKSLPDLTRLSYDEKEELIEKKGKVVFENENSFTIVYD